MMPNLKTMLFVLIAGLTFLSDSSAQTIGASNNFDPSGNYHPIVRPEGAADKFVQINLRLRNKNGRRTAVGEVRNVGKWYRFTTTEVNKRDLRFVTAPIDGVRYQFTGRFSGSGNFARQWQGSGLIFLTGSMRKYHRGRQVLEFATSYTYYPPH